MASSAGWSGHETWLFVSVLSAILGIVTLVVVGKVHPFLALILGSAWAGLTTGLSAEKTIAAFQKGVGETLGSVGVVLALGTMLGKLLADSGAAERIVSVFLERAGPRRLPWAMAAAAMLVGIPMFFEVGVVLLMPIIVIMARRTGTSIVRVGFPALAALSVCHGLIPPHPGPLIAAGALHADLGRMLVCGLVVAVPTIALAGPGFSTFCASRLDPYPPVSRGDPSAQVGVVLPSEVSPTGSGPGFALSVATILLPVALMIVRTAVELAGARAPALASFAPVGHPIAAMLIAVLFAMFSLGRSSGWTWSSIATRLGGSLGPIAAMVMVIGAGGGFKQTLVDSGIGAAIGKAAVHSGAPVLLLGWLLAAAIRVATGSATVATITASGLLGPLAPALPAATLPLLALSIGSGSLFFSHVNDAGFWLVKEYFGLTLGETLRSWSAMETLISLSGLAFVTALQPIVLALG